MVDQEDVLELVQPILDHLRDVITGPDHLGFLIAWLAQQVQDPAHPTHVAIILQGEHGVGKNLVFDFWQREVLGAGTAINTSNPGKDIFGTHSVLLLNGVFLLLDEISGEEMRPLMPRIKDLITAATVNLNPKNQTPYAARNLSNILCTTNQNNPVNIEPRERRFVVFDCNSSKKDNTTYFDELVAYLKRDDVARAFFQYMRDHVDVRPYLPFQAHRPQTDAYDAMQQRNIPLFYKFLSAQAEHALGTVGQEQTSLMGREFHQNFLNWGREGNYNTSKCTESAFGVDVGKLINEMTAVDPSQSALKKTRSGGGQRYTIHWRKLRDVLQKTKRYDPNAAV